MRTLYCKITTGPGLRIVGVGAGLALVVSLAPGCATRASVKRLEARATGVEQALGDVRRSEERLSREIRHLASEAQALEAAIRDALATAREAVSQTTALRGKLEALSAPTQSSTTQPRRTHSTPPTVETGLADPATSNPATTKPATSNPATHSPVTTTPERVYAAALATFRSREHGQAVLDFLEFIARYPDHPLAASAQYWIGEAYYAQHDYRQALVEFAKVLERPGPNASAPESLWKIGLCHAKLRAPGHARETWQRLLREYPGSEAARRARTRLTTRGVCVTR